MIVTDRVQGRAVYWPMYSSSHKTAVNLLTGNTVDVQTHTPAYKQTKVRMEVLKTKGQNPVPRFNPRNAMRTPQIGVYVERKWARTSFIQKMGVLEIGRALKDPDIHRTLKFAMGLLQGFRQAL